MSNGKCVNEMSKDEQEKLYDEYSYKVRSHIDYLAALSMFLEKGNYEKLINMNVDLAKILHPGD